MQSPPAPAVEQPDKSQANTLNQQQATAASHSPQSEKKHAQIGEEPELSSPLPTSRPTTELPNSFSCGKHICYRFDTPADVLVPLIMHHSPRILAFGETHAPAHFQGLSTVERFSRELLPSVSQGTDFLLVELLQPPTESCEKARKETEKESKRITKGQSTENQNEYLALGQHAFKLNITPDILRASCEDLQAIASPEGGVLAMMETIARLSQETLRTRLKKTRKGRPLLLAYGGALHNDAIPRIGREDWSYGPALVELTQGAYLEIDLLIPELIQATDSWRSFSWYTAYEELEHQRGVILMKWGENSYSLFFEPKSSKASPPPKAHLSEQPFEK